MRFRFLLSALVIACTAMTTPAGAETPRDTLLDIVEIMGNSAASKKALRPVIEKAKPEQISLFDRGLYFDDIGDPKSARKYYERALAALDPNTPGNDAWCVAYKLLRIPDDQVDQSEPVVKEMLDLRRQLKIPLTTGDLEKTATTARIRALWNALPEAAQAESGPLPKKLSQTERAVALAGRGFNQDERVTQPSQASARCWLRGPNLKPFYVEAAKLGLADFQLDLANDLAQTKSFPAFWDEAVKWYRQAAKSDQSRLSVIAATSAARVSERLLSAETPHPRPMDWPEILTAYRAGMDAGHEAAHVLYADALQRGLGGLKSDEAEAVRLYKSVLDKRDGVYGGITTMVYLIHAQEQITRLWQAGKIQLNETEQQRYLTLGTKPKS